MRVIVKRSVIGPNEQIQGPRFVMTSVLTGPKLRVNQVSPERLRGIGWRDLMKSDRQESRARGQGPCSPFVLPSQSMPLAMSDLFVGEDSAIRGSLGIQRGSESQFRRTPA